MNSAATFDCRPNPFTLPVFCLCYQKSHSWYLTCIDTCILTIRKDGFINSSSTFSQARISALLPPQVQCAALHGSESFNMTANCVDGSVKPQCLVALVSVYGFVVLLNLLFYVGQFALQVLTPLPFFQVCWILKSRKTDTLVHQGYE